MRNDVRAPEAVIEDACQFAWSRLLHHRDRVSRDRAVAWLVTTAVHEAFRLIRREDRELSLEALAEAGRDLRSAAGARPEELAVVSRRLDSSAPCPSASSACCGCRGSG